MNMLMLNLLQAVMVVGLAPLTVGIIRMAKARLQNRRGASVLQPYWMLLALSKKDMTITTHASWIFHAVPLAVSVCALMLACLVPTLAVAGPLEAWSSVFLVAALLALGSLFLVLGGMDVASAFGGMGASREMTLAALVEPALILILVTFGFAAHAWTMGGIVSGLAQEPHFLLVHPFLIFSMLAFGLVVLAENARYPLDNPATHLELTMVHEAMILEYSGPYLAMLEAASAIKLTVLGVFFFSLVWPFQMIVSGFWGMVGAIAVLLFKILCVGVVVAFLETVLVKMRLYRLQEYMAAAYFLGVAGLALTLVF